MVTVRNGCTHLVASLLPRQVTLLTPWIAVADQKELFKDHVTFNTPAEQVNLCAKPHRCERRPCHRVPASLIATLACGIPLPPQSTPPHGRPHHQSHSTSACWLAAIMLRVVTST